MYNPSGRTWLTTVFVTKELCRVLSRCLGHHNVALRKGTLLRTPGSGDDVEAAGKRKKESFGGSWQQGILGKGFAQGHIYLSVHLAAVLSPLLCLGLHRCRKAQMTQTVPVVQKLGVQECEKGM